jgi:hypothetical protein
LVSARPASAGKNWRCSRIFNGRENFFKPELPDKGSFPVERGPAGRSVGARVGRSSEIRPDAYRLGMTHKIAPGFDNLDVVATLMEALGERRIEP